MSPRLWLSMVLLLAGLSAGQAVHAQRYLPERGPDRGQDGGQYRENHRQSPRQDYLDLDTAVSQVRRRTGGRVLSAETKMGKDGPVHHIRILTDEGKVKRFRIDAGGGGQNSRFRDR